MRYIATTISLLLCAWSLPAKAQPVPNPYLSLLPPGVKADYAAWRARMVREGARRAAVAVRKGLVVVEEAEPNDTTGFNNTQDTAELIESLSADRPYEVEVLGTLFAPEPHDLGTLGEEDYDDGSIPLAREIDLEPGERVRAEAFIGDGPHGSSGSGTGDYDFYRVGSLVPGQYVTIVTVTDDEEDPPLDTKVGLYNSDGILVDSNDDRYRGERNSFLEFQIEIEDEYYGLVRGINMDWPPDPFDPGSGPKAGSEGTYELTIGLDARDIDYYGFQLAPGDILGATLEGGADRLTLYDPEEVKRMGIDFDVSALYPEATPLRFGGNANLAYVAELEGNWAAAVERGEGDYSLHVGAFRAPLEDLDTTQRLFIDFDGAVYNAEDLGGNPDAMLSPLDDFLGWLGLEGQGDTVIEHVMETVTENVADDIRGGLNLDYDIEILSSLSHVDPWGEPHVSRVIVGGTIEELGLNTIGIAESVDVGNHVTSETAIVLLDQLTGPDLLGSLGEEDLGPSVDMADVVGVAIGNIVSHEAGHFFANFHTGHPDFAVNLMDGDLSMHEFLGMGPDSTFGTDDDVDVDFGVGGFIENEEITGLLDTQNAIAFGLFGADEVSFAELDTPTAPATIILGGAWPNPFSTSTRFLLTLDRAQDVELTVHDVLGRRVRTVHEGPLSPGEHVFGFSGMGLAGGVYLVRSVSSGRVETRTIILVR